MLYRSYVLQQRRDLDSGQLLHLGAALVAVLSMKLNAFRDYQIRRGSPVDVTAVAGLTVLTGLSGQISLGNGAFMAIGAYTTALLLLHLGWPFIAVLVIAAAVTAAAGAIVGVARGSDCTARTSRARR